MTDNRRSAPDAEVFDVSILEQHLETLQRRQLDDPDPEREQATRELRMILNYTIHYPAPALGGATVVIAARLALDELERSGEVSPQFSRILRLVKQSHAGSLGTEQARRIRKTTPPKVLSEILRISSLSVTDSTKDPADRGDVDVLVRRAETGDRDAALQLARLLADRGDLDALHRRAAAGDQFASVQLARLLAECGDTEALTALADTGDRNAASQLAALLAQHGDTEALTALADSGDRDAAAELAHLLADRGDFDALHRRANAGDQFAAGRLSRARANDSRRRRAPRSVRNAAAAALAADQNDVEVWDGAGNFEVYKDRAGKYRFRLRASNGQVVASSEAYETKAAALKGCESVQRAAEGAPIVETEA